MNRNSHSLAFLLSFLAATAHAAPEIIPVVNFEAYGGQTRFDGEDGSFYGNGSWSVAPVMKFSNNDLLIPSYSGQLRRTVMVQELIGGSLLTQSQQDHIIDVKGIRRLGESAWKGKGHAGYKKELVRESNDEGWGDGLFDYNKYTVGFEFERIGKKVASFRTGMDVFFLRYPNFQSLSSQQFGTEIDAGTDVLDLNAFDWLSSVAIPVKSNKTLLSASLLLSPRFYTDARVPDESGEFTSDKRRDFYFWNAYNFTHTFKTVKPNSLSMTNALGLYASVAFNDSNQNNYDAEQTKFNENYYSYSEYQIGPRWNTKLRKAWDFNAAYTFSQRLYNDRPVQSRTGAYTASHVVNETQVYTGGASYALMRNLTVNANIAYQIAKSSQKYEQTYQYNYDSTHFFFGVGYSY